MSRSTGPRHAKPRAPNPAKFDRDYYRRFYLKRDSAVATREDMDARGRFIAAFAKHLGLDVRAILDAGCGLGLLRRSLVRAFPGASYLGLEVSPYLCQRMGWTQGSVAEWQTARRFDLVICYDVLQYLDAKEATHAIANLARHCRGALYFSTLTDEDWRFHVDRALTDNDAHLRPAAWYRRQLDRHFIETGMGLWVRRGAPVTLWSLEAAAPRL
ncbi:MAG: class I SAM-dependent methyltransferase [Rhodospirillaceae bacterium]|nr:class I SAM-dependent methyltransferase [Rhodospirillaceae bacterium]